MSDIHTDQSTTERPATTTDRRRRRHWRRWIVAGVVIIVVLVVVAAASEVNDWTEPPLTLPAGAATAPVDGLDGTWTVSSGSVAGFRVQQTILAMTGDVVGRTSHVTGTITIANGEVMSGSVQIDMTTMQNGSRSLRQFDLSLDTEHDPTASFTVGQPFALPAGFDQGGTVTATVGGQLAMHATSHAATVTVTARRDGARIDATGVIPVSFADWGIEGPTNYGLLASIADHGEAEFVLVLTRS